MSKAALALLSEDADETPSEPSSKRALALLEGRAEVPVAAKRPSFAMPGDRATPRDIDPRRGEAALSVASGLAGTTVGGIAGLGSLLMGRGPDAAAETVDWWKQALTYQPRTAQGEGALKSFGETMEHPANPLSWPGHVGRFAGESAERAGWDPMLSTGMQMAPEAIAALLGRPGTVASLADDLKKVGPTLKKAGEVVGDVREPPVTGTEFGADTASAAAASRINAARNISPELEADLRAQTQRGPLNPEAVDRQIDADALPIRMRLMEGQASKDPEVWSREFNAKGKDPEIAARFNEQNQQLIDNLDEFRREAAPQAVAHDPVQSGQNLVDAYKTLDNAASEEINAAYQAAREANGGDLPMDGNAFAAQADAALKKNMKARYLPADIAGDLAEIRDTGVMTFETFENMRTNIAAATRKAERSGDGNSVAALSLMRDALERVEPIGRVAEVKPLFDRARSLARERFDRIKADPAYKSAVNDDVGVGEASPLADKFVQKFIVGAPRAHVERMMGHLAGDELAMETVRAAPFNYLKQKAGIDPYRNEGDFSQHGYNRALAEVMPKLDLMVGAELAEQAQRLGRVAYDVKGAPAGSFPNRSNTFVAAAAEKAKGIAEQSANTLIGANIVPVGSWAREKLSARTVARESRERMRPAAGTLAKEKKP